jgi:hypothetical protein
MARALHIKGAVMIAFYKNGAFFSRGTKEFALMKYLSSLHEVPPCHPA